MRSVILLISGISVASAGGYYYRDSIPTHYRFWESVAVVELRNQIVEGLNPTPVDIAVLELVVHEPPQVPLIEQEIIAVDKAPEPVVNDSIITEHVEQLEKDARDYISDLSVVQVDTVSVKKADHFVGVNQVLELLKDDTFIELVAPLSSKPITQALAPRANSTISPLGSDFDTQSVRELVLIQTSSSENLQPLFSVDIEEQIINEPVMIVREASAVLPVLPELVGAEQHASEKPLVQPPAQERNPQITIADLLKGEKTSKEGSIYYVRTVKPSDGQGIWGIIVDGLTANFANGIAISRDESVDTYQVNIPRLSDDMLPNNTSSFLGKLVDRKTRECFVYNFVEKKIGRNPDLIYPGQELLIINFEAQELIDIYAHFVENS